MYKELYSTRVAVQLAAWYWVFLHHSAVEVLLFGFGGGLDVLEAGEHLLHLAGEVVAE